jgi:large subunit ribosomal protein L13
MEKIIIDGKNATLGRLASYVAKKSLEGKEIVILNCEEIIKSGGEKNLKKEFKESRERVGSGQKGPKISRNPERIVKRAIRGMLPTHRRGIGKDAFSRIRCYNKMPKEFENEKKVEYEKSISSKFIRIKELKK